MADSEGSASTGFVAIFAILLVIAMVGFITWRTDVFGARDHEALVHSPSSSR